jgi:phosphoribosylanthranilate isomerase
MLKHPVERIIIVHSDSGRCLEPDVARQLMSVTSQRKVMVTTCPDMKKILHLIGSLEPDVVQVHSEVRMNDLDHLRSQTKIELWALFPVRPGFDAGRLIGVMERCDMVHLDTPSQFGGGSGRGHDRNISRTIRDIVHPKGCVLAGGLDPSNVAEAVRIVGPDVVDVASGVEVEGHKSPIEVDRFIENARSVG